MPTDSLYITEQQGTGFSLEKKLVLLDIDKERFIIQVNKHVTMLT